MAEEPQTKKHKALSKAAVTESKTAGTDVITEPKTDIGDSFARLVDGIGSAMASSVHKKWVKVSFPSGISWSPSTTDSMNKVVSVITKLWGVATDAYTDFEVAISLILLILHDLPNGEHHYMSRHVKDCVGYCLPHDQMSKSQIISASKILEKLNSIYPSHVETL